MLCSHQQDGLGPGVWHASICTCSVNAYVQNQSIKQHAHAYESYRVSTCRKYARWSASLLVCNFPCRHSAGTCSQPDSAEGGRRAPVEVAHELVAQEGFAAAGQADQDDDQLLAVDAQLALAADAPAHAVAVRHALALLALLLAVVAGRDDDVLEVYVRAVLRGACVRQLLRLSRQPARSAAATRHVQACTCAASLRASLGALMALQSYACALSARACVRAAAAACPAACIQETHAGVSLQACNSCIQSRRRGSAGLLAVLKRRLREGQTTRSQPTTFSACSTT